MEWQPIETAPKDVAVLTWCDGDCSIAVASHDGAFVAQADGMPCCPMYSGDTSVIVIFPTHWMPLPAPPEPT